LVEKWNLPEARARDDFLHRFFHDLATPLSAVSLHLEGADRRVKRGADPSESLAVARAELSRAFELFDQARECLLHRAEEPQTFSFDDFVAATVQQNGASGVPIEGVTGGRVTADRDALSQALAALLTNAVEISGLGSISIHRERKAGCLRVRVENPGRLAAEDPETLFSPRATRPGRNWGMGLPRARLYAAAAGGMVRLEQKSESVAALLELPEETG
jgi:signal transduction histidine kinase